MSVQNAIKFWWKTTKKSLRESDFTGDTTGEIVVNGLNFALLFLVIIAVASVVQYLIS